PRVSFPTPPAGPRAIAGLGPAPRWENVWSEFPEPPGFWEFRLSRRRRRRRIIRTDSRVARVGPTSMRKPLSRPERDDYGTSQTSLRRHPQRRSALRGYAVAPIPYRGVAMRHVGPRDAA